MRSLITTLFVLLVAPLTVVLAQNDYPIVLVHGLSGWGRDELLGFKYWGVFQGDLEQQLNARGYTVYTAVVGPFSSNWDRACELYAYIKGGRVDYGENHAKTHKHTRYGRTFPGLYPEWGDVVNGRVNKVHLVGHSMGGQTIRMLTQLLASGSRGAPVEESITTSHTLFQGGKGDWVSSVTTISTPNQGSFLADVIAETNGDLVKNAVISLLTAVGGTGTFIYDAKLDQWGLEAKRPGESLRRYIDRVFASPIFRPGFKDISLWSVSTRGASEENQWVKTQPNVFYFSVTNEDTYGWRDILLREIQLPNQLTMLPPLQPLATFLGSRYGPDRGFSTEWQVNDGLVSPISQASDGVARTRVFDGTSVAGVWNVFPLLKNVDHAAIVGGSLHTKVAGLFNAHAKLLTSLPPTAAASGRALAESTVSSGNELLNAMNALNAGKDTVGSQEDVKRLCTTQSVEPWLSNYCSNALGQSSRRLLA